jgi:hypothetical protein
MSVSKSTAPRIHRHTLVEMNRSVFTARRDAAHARAMDLLLNGIEHGNKEQRAAWYADCLRLVEETLRSTQRSQIAQDGPLIHYLKLLREILNAQLALVNHEITLGRETQEFARVLGRDTVARLLADVRPFSDTEKFVLDSIRNLLQFGEPLRARDTLERQHDFTAEDRRRHQQAATEYTQHYSTCGR